MSDRSSKIFAYCVSGGVQGTSLNWRSLLYSIIPQNYLARISTAQYQVRMELCEAGRHNGALTMEHILWCGFLKFRIPHHNYAIWFVRTFLVIVVRGEHQLWKMKRPVHWGDASIFRPAITVETAIQWQFSVRSLISGKKQDNYQVTVKQQIDCLTYKASSLSPPPM